MSGTSQHPYGDYKAHSEALRTLIEKRFGNSDLEQAKEWKAKAETLLRRISLAGNCPEVETILTDLKDVRLEMTIQRLSGPDQILDKTQCDKMIALLRLAAET